MTSKVGSFLINTSIGEQSITNLGFKPKIVFFYPTLKTADGVGADAVLGFGAGVSSSEQFSFSSGHDNGIAASQFPLGQYGILQKYEITSCIIIVSYFDAKFPAAAPFLRATYVSSDSDGFTIDITEAPVVGWRIGYLALGEDIVTDVKIGVIGDTAEERLSHHWSLGETKAYTEVGFEPQAMIFLNTDAATITGQNPGGGGFSQYSLGFATGANNQVVSGVLSSIRFQNNDSNNALEINTAGKQETDKVELLSLGHDSGYPPDLSLTQIDSFDSDGFTLSFSEGPYSTHTQGENIFHVFVAMRGVFHVGSFNSIVSATTGSESGAGFTPEALMCLSFCNPSTSGGNDYKSVNGMKMSQGIATASDQFSNGAVSESNLSISNSDNFSDDGLIYQHYDNSRNVIGAIRFDNFVPGGFNFTQTDADDDTNELIYLLFGKPTPVVVVDPPSIDNDLHAHKRDLTLETHQRLLALNAHERKLSLTAIQRITGLTAFVKSLVTFVAPLRKIAFFTKPIETLSAFAEKRNVTTSVEVSLNTEVREIDLTAEDKDG